MPAVLEDAVYMVRLLTFVPGELVETVPFTTQLIYQLGQTLASVNNALQVLSVSYVEEWRHRSCTVTSTQRWLLFAYVATCT